MISNEFSYSIPKGEIIKKYTTFTWSIDDFKIDIDLKIYSDKYSNYETYSNLPLSINNSKKFTTIVWTRLEKKDLVFNSKLEEAYFLYINSYYFDIKKQFNAIKTLKLFLNKEIINNENDLNVLELGVLINKEYKKVFKKYILTK